MFHVSSLRVLRFIRINRRRPTPGPHKPSSGRGPAAQAAAPLFRPAPAAALISSYPTSLVTRPHISSGPVKSPPGDMGGHVAFPAHGGDSPGPRSQAVPVRPLLYRPGYPNAAQRPLLYRPSCIGLSAGPGPRAQISRGRSSLSQPRPQLPITAGASCPADRYSPPPAPSPTGRACLSLSRIFWAIPPCPFHPSAFPTFPRRRDSRRRAAQPQLGFTARTSARSERMAPRISWRGDVSLILRASDGIRGT